MSENEDCEKPTMGSNLDAGIGVFGEISRITFENQESDIGIDIDIDRTALVKSRHGQRSFQEEDTSTSIASQTKMIRF